MVKPRVNGTPKNPPRLEMLGIHKRFGATFALSDVTFALAHGEVHALIGENGAGKSTLMKILSGAYEPDKGEMFLDGELYQPRNPLAGRQKGIGMIYQELSLAPHLTVEENILLGMEPHRWGLIRWPELRKRAMAAIRQFDHPEIKPDTKVAHLSVSAKQLVEIGRSLAVGCRVLVFDEPTSSLAQQDISRLFDIIHQLRKQGISIIYISHFLEEVQQVADRLTVLRDGTVVGTREIGAVTPGEIIRMMVGRDVDELYPRSIRQPGEPILVIKNLAGVNKPESATLTLHPGEVLGICGLIGAGRTELLRTIFGLDVMRSGEIRMGVYAGPFSPRQRWLQGVGMLSENRKEEGLALDLSIADNITLSKLEGLGPFRMILPKRQCEVAEDWIDKLDIRCRGPEQPAAELSGGNQQKVALARLLQHGVDVLLLDEPTRGIDVAAKAKIYQLINVLAKGAGNDGRSPKAILIVSSYIPELLGICDRIAVMHRGKLSLTRNIKDLDEHKIMLAATGQAGF